MTSTPSPCLARARPWASCEALRLYSSQPWHPEGNCDPVPRPHPSHGPLGQLPAQLRLLPELRVRSDAEKSGMDTEAEIRETELRASSSITLHATSDVLLERPLQLCSQSSRPVRGLCKTTDTGTGCSKSSSVGLSKKLVPGLGEVTVIFIWNGTCER